MLVLNKKVKKRITKPITMFPVLDNCLVSSSLEDAQNWSLNPFGFESLEDLHQKPGKSN